MNDELLGLDHSLTIETMSYVIPVLIDEDVNEKIFKDKIISPGVSMAETICLNRGRP